MPQNGTGYTEGRFQLARFARFNRPDPMRDWNWLRPHTLNLYEYVGNDPVNMWDPDGLRWGYSGEGENRQWGIYYTDADGNTQFRAVDRGYYLRLMHLNTSHIDLSDTGAAAQEVWAVQDKLESSILNKSVGEGNFSTIGNEARFIVDASNEMVKRMQQAVELYGAFGIAKSMISLGKGLLTKLAGNTDDLAKIWYETVENSTKHLQGGTPLSKNIVIEGFKVGNHAWRKGGIGRGATVEMVQDVIRSARKFGNITTEVGTGKHAGHIIKVFHNKNAKVVVDTTNNIIVSIKNTNGFKF